MLSLTLLQLLSPPKRPREINSEISSMAGELLGQSDQQGSKPLLSFVRYDARLEEKWLESNCAHELDDKLTADYIDGLQQHDRPDLMDQMYKVGAIWAKAQVTPDDFPATFDPT